MNSQNATPTSTIRFHQRRKAVTRAYALFGQIVERNGLHTLRDVLTQELPQQGVYFFFDDSEASSFSRLTPRLVRIGTHAVSAGSTATLRNRLRAHLGTRAGSGNHRGSVFRLHVGRAIVERDGLQDHYPSWGKGQSAPRQVTNAEAPLEAKVSEYIGNLRVLFVPVLDTAGTSSARSTIERQFISMFTEQFCAIETSSLAWLGRFSDKTNIRDSGLWNVRDVGGNYDLEFMRFLDGFLKRTFF